MDMSQKIAPESPALQRDRKKLEKALNEETSKLTQDAIKLSSAKIHQAIASRKGRVAVKKRNFSLFNGNQDPAKCSKKIETLIEQLKKRFNSPS